MTCQSQLECKLQGLLIEEQLCDVQALATACVSCGPNQPADTKQATERVVDQLVLLVNPENSLEHVGTAGPVSFTCSLTSPCCCSAVFVFLSCLLLWSSSPGVELDVSR